MLKRSLLFVSSVITLGGLLWLALPLPRSSAQVTGQPVNINAGINPVSANFSTPFGSDSLSNSIIGAPQNQSSGATLPLSAPIIFNGASWDRLRSSSASNEGTVTGGLTGLLLTEKGPRWSQSSQPGTGSAANATQAAGGVGVQHVADCISFSAAANTAPTAQVVSVTLFDGATAKWSMQFEVLAAIGQAVPAFQQCGLNIIGTANTSMNLQFAIGITNVAQAVNLSGFDVK